MGTPNSFIQPLQKIQNFAARLVLLAPRRHHHSTALLEKLHWLPISERIKDNVACMCFSAINGSGYAYLSELLHVVHHLVHCALLLIPACSKSNKTNKTHGCLTLSCFGPRIWNLIPQDLRHCSTLSSFKAKLELFLFSQYFRPN